MSSPFRRIATGSVALTVFAAACDRSSITTPQDPAAYQNYRASASATRNPHDHANLDVSPTHNVIVNGSFEQNGGLNSSNSFPGWSVASTNASIGNWAVQSGTILLGTSTVPAPTDGQFAAFAWNTLASAAALYQDVAIPHGATTLSFDVAIENRAAFFFANASLTDLSNPQFDPNQQFRADLLVPTASALDVGSAVLLNLYQTHPGDALTGPYKHVSVDISAFAGQTVRLRFAVADNRRNFEVGIDNVQLLVTDVTPPVITYTGNLGTYSVDQTVAITCSATDDLSGVATTDCADIKGPAYTFSLGTNAFNTTATDNAGNIGTGKTTFTVTVSETSLCTLVQRFATKPGTATSLCAKLDAAAQSQGTAHSGQLSAFVNEVQAQTGKAIAAADAAVLIRLAGAL